MIKPVVKKIKNNADSDFDTMSYWLSKTPEDRLNAMGILHRQMLIIQGYKEIPRIKKIVKKVRPFN